MILIFARSDEVNKNFQDCKNKIYTLRFHYTNYIHARFCLAYGESVSGNLSGNVYIHGYFNTIACGESYRTDIAFSGKINFKV